MANKPAKPRVNKKDTKLQYFDIMITHDGSVVVEPWNKHTKEFIQKVSNKKPIEINPYCG